MVVEYLLLLLISAMILAGSFGLNTGPVKMFQLKSPSLAYLIETNLETGRDFKPQGNWQ
ncbi:MAG: hypothetical protein OXJ52_00465 [Oligoflexia bacterium]|nr:hypothetical protein [Oligoflexia bacterium]